MLLANVAAIRESLGFDDMVDITLAIRSALHSAEATLASTLGTDFGRASRTDHFYVHEPAFQQRNHVETKFLLKQGLLVPNTIAAVKTITPSEIGTGAAVEPILVDLGLGVVTDVVTRYAYEYVSITYEAGFDPDATDPESYDLSQVPTWLQRAATIATLIELETAPAMAEAGVKQDTVALTRQLTQITARKVRYAPTAILPI